MSTAPPPPADVLGTTAAAAPSTRGKVLRFLVVGGLSAVIDLGGLIALRELAGLPVPVATTIAFWTSLLVNFALNRAWSFGAGQHPAAAPFARYMVLVAANYTATLVIVTGGDAIGVPYALAKVVAIGLGAIGTYLAYDRWVFRP